MVEESIETKILESEAEPKPSKERNGTLFKISLVFIVIGVAWFLYWFFYLQYYEYTDDAYANGNMVRIQSAIPGSVVAYYADDTDFVSEGQLLVFLDDTPYQLSYEQELANLAAIVLDVSGLYDDIESAQALVDSRRIALNKARYDFENRAKLISSKAISHEDYTHSQDVKLTAEANLKEAIARLSAAADAAGPTVLLEHPLIEKQKSAVRKAYYHLQRCSIYAPSSGYIAQRSVEVGQSVSTQTNLMAVLPTDYVWVDANFKETQLTKMRVGQPATVWFDLYGSHVSFKGKVLGIASGTGSVFSIIPPQNATGNWIKIVQRLPVRIGLDPEQLKKYPSRLGISAEVNIDIKDQSLPYLTGKQPERAVAQTNVYEIDFEPIELLMNKLIDKQIIERADVSGL